MRTGHRTVRAVLGVGCPHPASARHHQSSRLEEPSCACPVSSAPAASARAPRSQSQSFAEAVFASRTLHLAPGEGLLLYTDGLTEARTAEGDMLADTGLTDFLARRTGPVSAGVLIDETVALLDTLPDTERDDVALLALSVPTPDAAPTGITTTAHSAAAPTADVCVGQENPRP
ncbi:SpoIIE family protein phosphatase [Streptomyces microflavus]|uniref:SpoIIE family protein phosphatase n=1 Tax=Streptomyces microflavus TaxID=1919 RepID=UPI00381280FF